MRGYPLDRLSTALAGHYVLEDAKAEIIPLVERFIATSTSTSTSTTAGAKA